MKETFFPALRLTLFCAVFFSGIYTLSIFGIAQFAPNHGKGEIVRVNGKIQAINVAQKFTKDTYFWPRPSAVNYNGSGSAGSNKGPNNPEYLADVKTRIDSFLLKNPGVKRDEIPSDLMTASGSGLDPDISVAAAKVQIKRVAKARNITEFNVNKLVEAHAKKPILGPESINVLELNIALDELKIHH